LSIFGDFENILVAISETFLVALLPDADYRGKTLIFEEEGSNNLSTIDFDNVISSFQCYCRFNK
jgi:hypothetical protein